MINYTKYHIMGKVSQVRMKPDCIPKKFECQENRRKRTYSDMERPYILKKQRLSIIAECLNEPEQSSTPSSSVKDTSNTSSDFQIVGENVPETLCELTADKSVQALITHRFRNINLHIPIQIRDHYKFMTFCVSWLSKITKSIFKESERSDSDISLYEPSASTTSCSPVHSLQVKSSSDCSEFIEEDKRLRAKETIMNMIEKIEKKPRLYIGVPIKCYYLIDIIIEELNIPKHHLLFCLNKIKLDSIFNQLSDDYAMTPSYLSKIFSKNIPLIASVMRPFIVSLDSEMIKKTLPMAFRHKYNNVGCIIDCLEIEIEKPSKAINQALTWSDYKKANTIKY
ncbi:hypothetical protein ACJJTC_018236 [Scirpophaga incertulas]